MNASEVLLMSRLDFEIRELDIPPVPEEEVEGLIRYRLRGVYPGNPDDTAFDFRLFGPIKGQGRARRAIVFVARKTVADRYRTEAGGKTLALPLSLISRSVPRAGDFRVWVVDGSWAEHISFQDGIPVSFIVNKLTRGKRFELTAADESLPAGLATGSVVVMVSAENLSSLQLPDGTRTTTIEDAARKLRKGDGLFLQARKRPRVSTSLRISGLSLAIVLLSLLLLVKYVSSAESHANALRSLTVSLEKSGQNVLTLQKEIDGLKAERDRLIARSPRDVYQLLSQLSLVFGDRARIQSISIQDNTFQVDALGTNALSIMEGFKSKPGFKNMKLAQVVPDPATGKERFSFSGAFDGK